MVKIKIQSAEDIIKAYLACLGYKKDINIQPLITAYPQLSQATNVLSEMDNIIYHFAQHIFGSRHAKAQTVALFKAVFIDNNIAQTYGILPLLPKFENSVYEQTMKSSGFSVAPAYKITKMPTQEISPIHLHKKSK